MSHLYLASDNRAVSRPFTTRRERLARAAMLGMSGVTGDRPMPVASSRPVAGSYADFARRAEERRNPTPPSDYVDLPCDV